MIGNKIVHYYVEGECEQKLVRTLIDDFKLLPPGTIKVLNIKQKLIPKSILINLHPGSYIVFIFDTDVDNYEFLIENRKILEKMKAKIKIILLPQVKNLEDELKRSCNIRQIRELTHSRSDKDFKRDFIKAGNLMSLMKHAGFDYSLLWEQKMPDSINIYENGKKHLI